MFSRLRLGGRVVNRRWASSSSHDAAYERATAVYEQRAASTKSTILGLAVPLVILAVGASSVSAAKWTDRAPTPYNYVEVKKQLEVDDRDQLMQTWAEESKNLDGGHWITNMIARNIPDREANQEALRRRLKEGRETAIKRLDLWAAPERTPPKGPQGSRGTATALKGVHEQ